MLVYYEAYLKLTLSLIVMSIPSIPALSQEIRYVDFDKGA